MGLSLWLDDRRTAPWGYDLHARTYEECVALFEQHGDEIECVSLDHDLAEEHYEPEPTGYTPAPPLDRSKYKTKTGYAVVEWMVARGFWPRDVRVHSLSRRGAEDMLSLLKRTAPPQVSVRRVKPTEV